MSSLESPHRDQMRQLGREFRRDWQIDAERIKRDKIYLEHEPFAREAALAARELSDKDSDVRVGVAMVVVNQKGEVRIVAGYNTRRTAEQDKYCGEGRSSDQLEDDEVVAGIKVIGDRNRDNGSGLLSRTLHPCEVCRPRLMADPRIPDDVAVESETPDGEREILRLFEIVDIHDQYQIVMAEAAGLTAIAGAHEEASVMAGV